MAKKKEVNKPVEGEQQPPEVDETALLKEELEKQKDLLLRTAAEFDNYKKRTERERIMTAEYTKAQVIKTLLPVFDNVDRAEAFDPDSAEYAKGAALIIKQLNEVVSGLGIVELGAVGDVFDPSLHEAVMHVEDEQFGESVITEVFQKGYRIGDTVIRAAMVKVAN